MKSRNGAMTRALGLAAALVAGSCGGDRGDSKPAPSPPPVASKSATDGSEPPIYGLDLPLIDQEGRPLVLADLRGRVLVAAMMYGSCKSVCPRVTEDMKAVEARLPRLDRDRVEFVLFSLDPGRDTPAALRRFAGEHALDLSRWRLLAASEDGVRDLAAVLGLKYKPEAGGEIAHSAMIFVIDREGIVRLRQEGLNKDPSALVAAVSATGR
ncbi:MAG: SCO family protein [Candidatus Eisenbacteria bacterium]